MSGKKEKPVLARNIVARRSALGWNADTLAEKAGVPYPTLRDIEAGSSNKHSKNLLKIAKTLRCNPDDLYLRPEIALIPTDILEALQGADEHQIRQIRATLGLLKQEDSKKKSN